LAAFELAIQLGVDAVELDVRASSDGKVVVIHDPTLDRTTNRTGAVNELTLAEIRRADAGSHVGPAYRGERIPTLDEVLDLTRNRALALIEIKADYLAERVLEIVDLLDAGSQVMIQSFDPDTVRRVNALDPTLPTALLVGKLPTSPSRVRARRMVREIVSVGANALAVWHATLTPQFFEEMRRRAVSVWTWTVDEEVIMRDMVQLGVQGIITNYPDRLNGILSDLESMGLVAAPLGRRQRLKQTRWGRRRRIRKLSRRNTRR